MRRIFNTSVFLFFCVVQAWTQTAHIPATSKVCAKGADAKAYISWSSVPTATAGFRVIYTTVAADTSNAKASFSASSLVASGNTSLVFSGLTNNILYYFAVVSVGGDTSNWAAAVPVMQSGKAIALSGTQYLHAANASVGNFGTADFTVEAWFRTTSASGILISNRFVASHGRFFHMGIANNGVLAVEIDGAPSNISTSSYNAFSGKTVVTDGLWHHVALTRVGSTATLYLDGQVDMASTVQQSADVSSGYSLDIGARNLEGTGYAFYFTGEIDEVRVWNEALGQTQLNISKDKPLQGTEPGLLSLWHFDEPSGNIAYDATCQDNYFTLNNAPSFVVSKAMYPYKPLALTLSGTDLTWESPNTATDVKSYTLFEQVGNVWDSIGTTPVDAPNFTFASACTTAYFKVAGVDSAGQVGTLSDSLAVLPFSNLDSVLIAHYKLDNSVQDAVSGTVGSIVGAVSATTDRMGNANSAYHLEGGYIDTGQNLKFTNTQSHSISLWIKTDPALTSGSYSILGRPSGNWDNNININFNSKKVIFRNWREGGAQGNVNIAYDFDPLAYSTKWHNITVTYDASTRYFTLYEDGLAKAQAQSINDVFGTSGDLLIGSGYTDGATTEPTNFAGSIDDLRIYNRALKSKELDLLSENIVPDTFTICHEIGSVYTFNAAKIDGASYVWQNPDKSVRKEKGDSIVFSPLKASNAGKYVVSVTSGCSVVKDSVLLRIPVIDTAMGITGSRILCSKSSITLTSKTPADSVRWFKIGTNGPQKLTSNASLVVSEEGSYYFRNYQGICYDSSRVIQAVRCLAAPQKVYAIAGNKKTEVHWSKVPAATGYTVFYGTDSTKGLSTLALAATDTSVVISNLNNNTLYFVAVSGGGDTSVFDGVVPVVQSGGWYSFSSPDNGNSKTEVTVPYSSVFNFGTQDFTLETWYQYNASSTQMGTNPVLVSYNDDTKGDAGYVLGFKGNTLWVRIAGNDFYPAIPSKVSPFDGQPHHYAISRINGQVLVYVDGFTSSTTLTAAQAVGYTAPSANGFVGLTIGNGQFSSNLKFDGKIDEVRIWSGGRSATQLNNSKDTTMRGDELGLIALYHFDEVAGGRAYDATPHALNGIWNSVQGAIGSKALFPYKPLNFKATASVNQVSFTWDANTATDIARHKVLMYNSSKKGWDTVAVASATSNAASYTASASSCDTLKFKVVAIDKVGQIGIPSDSAVVIFKGTSRRKLSYSGDTTFCMGSSLVLTAKPNATSYRWYYGTQLLKSGPDSTYTATLSGAYCAIVVRGTCLDTSQFVYVKAISPITTTFKTSASILCPADTATISVTSMNGNSFQFKGSKTSYLVRNNAVLQYDGKLTTELWMKADATNTTDGYIASYSSPLAQGNIFAIHDPTSLKIEIVTSFSFPTFNTETFDTKYNVADGKWHHVVFSFNAGECSFYLDGKFYSKTTFVNSGNFSNNNVTADLYIGQNRVSGTNVGSFEGELDELRFWTVALDSNTIKNNYNVRLKGTEPGLFVLAHLNDSVGSTLAKEEVQGFNMSIFDVQIVEGGGIADKLVTPVYTWMKDGDATASANANTLQVTEKGNYSLHLSNGFCSDTTKIIAIQKYDFRAYSALGKDTLSCSGDSVKLFVDNVPGVRYLWSDSAKTYATKVGAGAYGLQVDSAGLCPVRDTIHVYLAHLSKVAISDTFLCNQRPITLTQGIRQEDTLTWYEDGKATKGTTFLISSPGVHFLQVDSGNCSLKDTFMVVAVTVNATIKNLSTDSTLCGLSSFPLHTLSGPYTYQWRENSAPVSSAQDSLFTAIEDGVYDVIVRDFQACADTSSQVMLHFVPKPDSVQLPTALSICAEDTLPVLVLQGLADATFKIFLDDAYVLDLPQLPLRLAALGIDNTVAKTYKLGVQQWDGTCPGDTANMSFTILPLPEAPVFDSTLIKACQGETLANVQLHGTAVADSFYVVDTSIAKQYVNATGIFSPSDIGLDSNVPFVKTLFGRQKVRGCLGDSSQVTVIVYKRPDQPNIFFVNPNKNTICEDGALVLGTNNIDSCQWYREGFKIAGATGPRYNAVVDGMYWVVSTTVEATRCPVKSENLEVGLSSNYQKPAISMSKSGSVTQLLTNVTAESYQWYVNGRILVGAKGTSFLTQYNGTYMLQVHYGEYCTSFSDGAEVADPSYLSAERVGTLLGDSALWLPEVGVAVVAYPNPFQTDFHLAIPLLTGEASVALLDMYGREVWEKKSTDSFMTIESKGLSSGMYLLKVIANGSAHMYVVEKVK